MDASNLDRRVTFQREVRVPDGAGGSAVTYEDLGTVWAGRADMSDGERVNSQKIETFLASRFVVRNTAFTKGIRAADRILHDGQTLEITGIKEAKGPRGQFLEFSTEAVT